MANPSGIRCCDGVLQEAELAYVRKTVEVEYVSCSSSALVLHFPRDLLVLGVGQSSLLDRNPWNIKPKVDRK